MRDRPKGGMSPKAKKGKRDGDMKGKELPKRGQRTAKNKGDCSY